MVSEKERNKNKSGPQNQEKVRKLLHFFTKAKSLPLNLLLFKHLY